MGHFGTSIYYFYFYRNVKRELNVETEICYHCLAHRFKEYR